MKQTGLVIIYTMASLLLSANLIAQTAIPGTAGERLQKAMVLEKTLETEQNPRALRELAMIYAVIAGLDDPEKATTLKAEGLLKKASIRMPGDYELMAAHGSVLTMLARYEKSSARQLHFVKKGFRKMDRAIRKDPDNIGALMQRANNSLAMPPFLKRVHFAQKDFQRVLALTDDKHDKTFKAMVLFKLGQAHKRLNQQNKARASWQQSSLLKAPCWSDQAARELDELQEGR